MGNEPVRPRQNALPVADSRNIDNFRRKAATHSIAKPNYFGSYKHSDNKSRPSHGDFEMVTSPRGDWASVLDNSSSCSENLKLPFPFLALKKKKKCRHGTHTSPVQMRPITISDQNTLMS